MGFGGTAKKLQKVAGMAEDLYAKMNDVVSQVQDLQSDLEATSDQVDDLEQELTEQRALVEALAAQQDVDVQAVLADVGSAVEDETAAEAAGTDVAVEDGNSAPDTVPSGE
jgi:DNA anti-recombination protein RmuC